MADLIARIRRCKCCNQTFPAPMEWSERCTMCLYGPDRRECPACGESFIPADAPDPHCADCRRERLHLVETS